MFAAVQELHFIDPRNCFSRGVSTVFPKSVLTVLVSMLMMIKDSQRVMISMILLLVLLLLGHFHNSTPSAFNFGVIDDAGDEKLMMTLKTF